MSSATVPLVGPEVQNGRIEDIVAIAVLMDDLVNFGCMTFDEDRVPFVPVKVDNHFVADTVNPVIMNIVVFTSDTVHAPVDRAVIVDVLEDDVSFGVNQRAEVKCVGTIATDKHIVRFDWLIWVKRASRVVDLVIRIILGVVVLDDHRLTRIGIADEPIVAVPAHDRIFAVTAAQDIVAGSAEDRIITIASVNFRNAKGAGIEQFALVSPEKHTVKDRRHI